MIVRNFCYWACFAAVVLACVLTYGAWAMTIAGIDLPFVTLLYLLSSFGSLVPPMFAPLLPRYLVVGLGLVMLVLVIRRAWLVLVKRHGVPDTFVGIPMVLGYIGVSAFILALAVPLLNALFRGGNGVSPALLALPALFCIPWAFFFSEVFSIWRVKRRAG